MKVVNVVNGKMALYLQPETEIEKLILQSLFSGPVDSKQHASLQVGTIQLVDAVEIVPSAVTTKPQK